MGDPADPHTQLGPLISKEQFERVTQYIELGVDEGARVLTGASRIGDRGYFIRPTVFDEVSTDMRIAQEEIFGPVIAVMEFDAIDEAIEIANAVDYGLAATVWTNALDIMHKCESNIDAGIIWINCPHHLQWNVPYEGHKASGLGEDLGLEASYTFTKLKVAYVNHSAGSIDW